MLELNQIVKTYVTGNNEVHALNGVSLKFRRNEFVSILGPSGCGKTTLLNIVGGLDQYTSGDLIINGVSTKKFKARDWDTYRNHSVGFVFQSYNLIPHQSVLSNVELALTLSGVSKSERRARAIQALTEVGLGDQLHKRPSQMSGGQMQRVAIARALVNNPDILLADEPTGALDTSTSVQIMELLKEVAKDRLVIMVTHNPELAEEYSTRIVRLRDGMIMDDSAPFEGESAVTEEEAPKAKEAPKKEKKAKKKTSMSFLTALSLSRNNLLTKKGRTILTSFAGSIGIIGIALILSLSNGIQIFIDQVQEDTLSTYPLTISKTSSDYTALLTAMTQVAEVDTDSLDENMIYVDDSLGTMMGAMSATVENDLTAFKAYLDEHYDEIKDSVSDIQYTYDLNLHIYSNTENGITQVSPTTIFDKMGPTFQGIGEMMNSMTETMGSSMGGMNIFTEMIDNRELLNQQYDLVGEGSRWPENPNEVVLVVGKNNTISKMALYMLGIENQDELEGIMNDLMSEGKYEGDHMEPIPLEKFLGMKFYVLNAYEFYEKSTSDKDTYPVDGETYYKWIKKIDNPSEGFITENGTELVISGIVRPKPGITAGSITGVVGYTRDLTNQMLANAAESELIQQQKAAPEYNALTAMKFERTHYTPKTIGSLIDKIDGDTMSIFYASVTQMILKDPQFAAMLDVTDAESLLNVLFLMPEAEQAAIFNTLATAAKEKDPMGFAALCATLTGISPDTTVTPDNFQKLLPILSQEQLLVALMGMAPTEEMPMLPTVKGIIDLAGEEKMQAIYAGVSETLKTMEVNEEIFKRIIEKGNSFIPNFATSETFLTLEETLYGMAPQIDATYESVMIELGAAEKATPASINFYAKDFASKDKIEQFIQDYSDAQTDETKKIQYNDVIGTLMSSVSTIIDVISYILVAFVSVSLVVSSIMIGIITYISVLERTKEIGILRAIGASKRDISRVFNAETLIVGFIAGLFGVGLTLLFCLPINLVIHLLTGMTNINAVLPWGAAIILVAISMFLTFIAGLIPARVASKKDPVEALRSE